MSASAKRLLKELASFRKEGNPALEDLAPEHEDNMYVWKAVLRGPEQSPYEKGLWTIRIRVPEAYPLQPPEMHFRTRICHPNIHFDTGEVCLDVLKNQWTPAWTLSSALTAVQAMLSDPEPDSPLNIDAANLVRCREIKGYEALIRYYAVEYAGAPATLHS